MLVLSRKTEQTIQIGDDIKVTILRVKGNYVKVGVEAPEQVRILRSELVPTEIWGAESKIGHQLSKQQPACCK